MMRVLLQRVTSGSVGVGGNTVGRISHGLVMLLGVGHADTLKETDKLAQKSAELRIFSDDQGRFNRSLLDVQGGALVVSQFTLYADSRRGRRPSFTDAASPEQASILIDRFSECLREQGVDPVACGLFGAHMAVEIHNDGPVTIWLDSDDL